MYSVSINTGKKKKLTQFFWQNIHKGAQGLNYVVLGYCGGQQSHWTELSYYLLLFYL